MIAFTFPGQGSQRPGAGAAWLDHPAWRIVEAATAATGRDVARLLLDADAEELRATDNAQLSTYVASLLVLDAVRRGGLEASHLAGHSLGEYTALTAAGVLTIEDGARLVAERGAAMLDASRSQPGTMAAVLGADDDAVEAACAEVRAGGLDAWVANYNAPGQVVVAGSAEGLEAAGSAAKARGAKRTMPVAVSGAFHTPYMAPAQDRLDRALAAASLRRRRAADRRQRRRCPAPQRCRVVGARLTPAVLAGPLGAGPAHAAGRGRDDVHRDRPGHGAHRHGQADRDRRDDRLGGDARRGGAARRLGDGTDPGRTGRRAPR